jgi:hypothetical protein
MEKIISEINSLADMEELQDDLDSISTWGAVNGMELNATLWKSRAAYIVSGTVLSYSTTERILGGDTCTARFANFRLFRRNFVFLCAVELWLVP